MRTTHLAIATALAAAAALAQTPCGIPGVTVSFSPAAPALGQTVTVTLTNNSNQTIVLSDSCVFDTVHEDDCSGRTVFAPFCLQVLTPIPSGQSRSTPWDQTDNNGQQVPPGVYGFAISYRDANFNPLGSCCATVGIGCGTMTRYGSGCASSVGRVPMLSGAGCLAGGETITLEVAGGPSSAPAILAFGLGRGSIPLTPGCAAEIGPPTSAALPFMLSNTGSFSASVPVPAGVSSATVTTQMAALDTAVTPAVLTLSNALELQLP